MSTPWKLIVFKNRRTDAERYFEYEGYGRMRDTRDGSIWPVEDTGVRFLGGRLRRSEEKSAI